jgi:hypothetical protein
VGMITIGGTDGRKALAEYLRSGIPGASVVEGDGPFAGEVPDFKVLLIDIPPGELGAAEDADLVLVERGPAFDDSSEVGIESAVKEATGSRKVLIYCDEEGRKRAFRKALDMARSQVGGGEMPDDIPEEVVEAVRKEAAEGRITCARAQQLAGELGVPIPLVGRALDLMGIKIVECQLGCF